MIINFHLLFLYIKNDLHHLIINLSHKVKETNNYKLVKNNNKRYKVCHKPALIPTIIEPKKCLKLHTKVK